MKRVTVFIMAMFLLFVVNAQTGNIRSVNNPDRKGGILLHDHSSAKVLTSVTFLNEGFELPVFPPAGWTKISADGGTGWTRVTNGTTPVPGWQGGTVTVPVNGGEGCAFCTWNTGGATSNDQWLITPQLLNVKITDTLSFWAIRTPKEFKDELQIKISTGNASSVGDFTINGPVYTFPAGSGDSVWVQYRIPIGSLVSAGSNVYVAFREFVANNSNDGSSISIDNVSWGVVPSVPAIGISQTSWNAGDVEVSTSATSLDFTLVNTGGDTLKVLAVSGLSAPFSTSLDPASVRLKSNESKMFTFSFDPTVLGVASQTATISTNAGDVVINLDGKGVQCTGITTFPWVESFEGVSFPPFCWTKINPDGGSGWASLSGGVTPLPGWRSGICTTPSTGGSKVAYATWETGGSTGNDQWLITPKIAVSSGKALSFYIYRFGYYQDFVDVKVSATDKLVPSFTSTLMALDSTTVPMDAWTLKNVSLDAFSGQEIYVGFNEHVADNTKDGAFIALDLVKIDVGSKVGEHLQDLVSIFPTPASQKLYVAANRIRTVEIFNLTGARVASFGNQSVIDVSNLAEGAYLIRVITESNVIVQKISVVR